MRKQDLLIDRSQGEIEIIKQDIERLGLMDKQLAEDTEALDKMMADAQLRITRIRDVETEASGLAESSYPIHQCDQQLRERQSKAMLALSDDEMVFLEQRITQGKSNTDELVSGLQEALNLKLKSTSLKDSIRKFEQDIKAEVTKQQDEVTQLISKVDDPNESKNLFIANQETLSELLRGIPEYVVSKRRLLETANLNLHLMRRRYALVAGLTGVPEDWPSTYVRNGSQLAAMVG